jgi:site-specific recombinase
MSSSQQSRNPVTVVLGWFAVIGALFVAVSSLTTGFCDEPVSFETCETRLHVMRVVAVIGLLPALATLIAALRREDLLALFCFVLAVFVYALWGYSLDRVIQAGG